MVNESLRFLHSADWQLGMTRAFLSGEAAARFTQDRIDAIARLGRRAAEEKAAFILVAGDVFESNQIATQTLQRACDALAELPVPIYLLPGNHDPLDPSSIYARPELTACGSHVRILSTNEPIAVPEHPGVELLGAPWLSKRPDGDLVAGALADLTPAEGYRILVAHGQTDKLAPDASQAGLIQLAALEEALRNGVIHYAALGDRHSTTDVGTTGRCWYAGAPVATAFRETDPNQALSITLSENHCEVRCLPVGGWHFVHHEVDLESEASVEALEAWLDGVSEKTTTALRLTLRGTLNLAAGADLDRMLEAQSPRFASLERRQRTSDLKILPDELDGEGLSLVGYARDAFDELKRASSNDDADATEALKLLYRLAPEQP